VALCLDSEPAYFYNHDVLKTSLFVAEKFGVGEF